MEERGDRGRSPARAFVKRVVRLIIRQQAPAFTDGHSQYTWLGFDVAFAGIEIGGGNVAVANENYLH